jgi:hypothetical protein
VDGRRGPRFDLYLSRCPASPRRCRRCSRGQEALRTGTDDRPVSLDQIRDHMSCVEGQKDARSCSDADSQPDQGDDSQSRARCGSRPSRCNSARSERMRKDVQKDARALAGARPTFYGHDVGRAGRAGPR